MAAAEHPRPAQHYRFLLIKEAEALEQDAAVMSSAAAVARARAIAARAALDGLATSRDAAVAEEPAFAAETAAANASRTASKAKERAAEATATPDNILRLNVTEAARSANWRMGIKAGNAAAAVFTPADDEIILRQGSIKDAMAALDEHRRAINKALIRPNDTERKVGASFYDAVRHRLKSLQGAPPKKSNENRKAKTTKQRK